MARVNLILKARLVIEKKGKILLLKQTKPNGGKYTLIGGKVENYELVKPALIRESFEEAGVILKEKDLTLVHTLHKKVNANETRIVLYFRAEKWGGELESREPWKFKRVEWHRLDNLPANFSPTIRHFLKHYRRGIAFSEFSVIKKLSKTNP